MTLPSIGIRRKFGTRRLGSRHRSGWEFLRQPQCHKGSPEDLALHSLILARAIALGPPGTEQVSRRNTSPKRHCGAFGCCYSVMAMAIKKSKLDAAVRRTAGIIEEHLGALPATKAKAMLKDIHKLAVKSSCSAGRGEVSRSRRSGGPRPLSRASAKPA